MRVGLIALGVCLLAACGGDDQGAEAPKSCTSDCAGAPSQPMMGDAGAPSEPVTGDAADFCQRFVDEYAEYMESCGCPAVAVDGYRQESFLCQSGEFLESVVAAVAAGDLVYDPDAA